MNFWSTFAVKTLSCYRSVANADIGSLKSLHTFFKKCLYHMQVKYEQNCTSKLTIKLHEILRFFFFFFNERQCVFLNIFLTKRWRHLKMFLQLKQLVND